MSLLPASALTYALLAEEFPQFNFALFRKSWPGFGRRHLNESPALDDSDARAHAEGTETAESLAKKRKMHWCSKCELKVVTRYENPHVLAPGQSVVEWIDLVYLPQVGPVCGAASVAGTLRSLARYHGLPADEVEGITVRTIQDVYNGMGVPGVYTTTAAVGNGTIKRAFMSFAFPGAGWSPIVSTFGSTFVTDPVTRADVDWDRFKTRLAAGSRFLLHVRNHYCRLFGWREVSSPGSSSRLVLIAKRGQRPQHWVAWEDLMADIDAHKGHHTMLEIKLKERPVLTRRAGQDVAMPEEAGVLATEDAENIPTPLLESTTKPTEPAGKTGGAKPWLRAGGNGAAPAKKPWQTGAGTSNDPLVMIF